MQYNSRSLLNIRWEYLIILLIGIIIGAYLVWQWPKQTASAKVITLVSRGLHYEIVTEAEKVSEFLSEQGMQPDGAKISHDIESAVTNGMQLTYSNSIIVNLADGDKTSEVNTNAATVGEFLQERGLLLAPTDTITPPPEQHLSQNMNVVIERISITTFTEAEPINFETQVQGDANLLYGTIEILNAGSRGRHDVTYEVTYKNGIEASRRELARVMVVAPTPRIERHGRKMEVEAYEIGRGSWYAYRGCMCAAHPFFPKGSMLRVTSEETGKSIIVTVNDFGPNQSIHPDRVIDLDSVAFRQLAPLGAGTIQVKVEKLKTQ